MRTNERTMSDASPRRLPGAKYWRRLAPGLHVNDDAFMANVLDRPMLLSPAFLARCKAQLLADGFITMPPKTLAWSDIDFNALRAAVRQLQRQGWPASLLLMYDEVWAMALQLSRLMATVSGGCANSLDMLAWSVTPALGQSGFAPHRDRQPADVGGSFRADGTAKYTTAWVALSEATPDNSCLYLVPRQHDPGYVEGDDHSPETEDPLIRVLRSDVAVQAVRACPLRPGGVVIFTHRAMHWGSKGQELCAKPRVSVSFGFSDPTFEAPFFKVPSRCLPFPKVSLRAALASAQLINYHERFDFGLPLLRRFGATYRASVGEFTAEYAQKTAAEFMDACHDRRAAQTAAAQAAAAESKGAAPSKKKRKKDASSEMPSKASKSAKAKATTVFAADADDDDAEGALDDALDAMLDAQGDAADNLYDDFDDWA